MKKKPTVLGLMGLIAIVAVGMAALRTNDQSWAAILLVLTIAALCVSSLFAIYRRGAWAGFAVFGWALFLICQPHSAPTVGPTTLPLEIAYRVVFYVSDPIRFPWVSFRIPGYPAIMADGDGNPMLGAVQGINSRFLGMVPVNTLRAGLCLLSLGAGIVGAIVGGFIDRHSAAEERGNGGISPGRDKRIG